MSPDGQQIAFLSDRGGRRGIWVMNADGGAARQLVEAQVIDTISWSPDGAFVVYAVTGNVSGLRLVSLADGSVRALETPGPATAPSWSPRGDSIAYIESDPVTPTNPPHIAFVSQTGAPPPSKIQVPIPNGALAWDRTGRRLAAIGNQGVLASVVWVIEPGTRIPPRRIAEFPPDVRLRGVSWSSDGTSLVIGQQRQDRRRRAVPTR